jgi:hypothetical protein
MCARYARSSSSNEGGSVEEGEKRGKVKSRKSAEKRSQKATPSPLRLYANDAAPLFQ